MTATPTAETYQELQTAYDHFNKGLFGGSLPLCLITLQRKSQTYGYFCPERFVNRAGDMTDEIAMNPEWFAVRSVEEVLSTLAHEMAHLWQAHFGNPGRARYHNKEWGNQMEAIGLMPSNTGELGGKRTGDQMTHYVIEGGAFQGVCAGLLTTDYTLSWMDRFPAGGDTAGVEGVDGTEGKEPKKATRIKYSCPSCGINVWGKPALRLRCAECEDSPLFEEME